MAINKKRLMTGVAGGITATDHFNIVEYVGDGTSSNEVSVGFTPDLTWVKARVSDSNYLVDSVRGNGDFIFSNAQNANDFNSAHLKLITNGFDAMSNPNVDSRNYISLNWKGGGSSNTWNIDGTGYASAGAASLTGTTGASVNTVSGFSIIKYAGSGSSNQVIPHGLTDCQLVFVKNITSSTDWQAFAEPIFDRMQLNNTGSDDLSHGFTLSSTSITSPSLVATEWNGSGQNYIAYCFTSIDGFSKVGSYSGTNDATQSITNVGFRPRLIVIKGTNVVTQWNVLDSVRGVTHPREWNTSNAEQTRSDFLQSFDDDGFTIAGDDAVGGANRDFVYIAYA